jgi:chitin synthase
MLLKKKQQANYFIAFTILAQSMEDPSFNLKGINIVNDILSYFYLGLLIMCFILALGNRPQGSKWGYTMAFVGFGVITIYMTVRFFLFIVLRGNLMMMVVCFWLDFGIPVGI